jgi:hypothetical protein
MEELYAPFVRTGKPILRDVAESAEMTKYAANAMLAARISFMNEIANLCERVGADVDDVRRGVGLDARIGPASCSRASATAARAFRRTSRRSIAPRPSTARVRACCAPSRTSTSARRGAGREGRGHFVAAT